MLDAERRRELVQGHHRRVALTAFKAAYVLLRKAGALGELLLRQTPLDPSAPDVAPYESPHVHADTLDGYTL